MIGAVTLSAALLLTPAPAAPFETEAREIAPPAVSAETLPGSAPRRRQRLTLEAGALWTSRNDERIPGDSGTRFALDDLTGGGAWPVGRVTYEIDLDERHGLRFLYAPIRTDGRGTLSKPVDFAGTSFAAGPAEARYVFDTYRLGYRYRFFRSARWDWRAGVTLLARDAEIEVEQGGASARDTDFGLVPLLNLTGEYAIDERWTAVLDVEGAGSPQGRAVDAALTLGYDVEDDLRLSFGYRTIEGGADNDSVYTFAWIHQAVVSLRWSW